MSELPDLNTAFEREGLIDVAYTFIDSPVGRLLLAATPRGLARVAYVSDRRGEHAQDGEQGPDGEHDEPGEHGEQELLERLAASISPRVIAAPARLDQIRRELERYFAGQLTTFATPLDLTLAGRPFMRRVLHATSTIPYGALSSYAAIATQAGSPRAFRAAGSALGANPLPIVIPCHRVLRSDGALGGYTGGTQIKRALLALEAG